MIWPIALLSLAVTAQAAPNVLMIVSDDQGWRDIGYRSAVVKTPNLDGLANAGVKLEHHYVFSMCSPTRCALLTGTNPARFGILGAIGGKSALAVPQTVPNIASLLKTRGYRTALAGKWHLSLQMENGPRKYGFDSTYGYLHGQIDPLLHDYKQGDRTWHRDDVPLDEPGHATDLIAEEAIRVIEKERTQPFFLYVAFSVPHEPLHEAEQWLAPYRDKFPEPTRQLVAASITHMDDAIGRIVGALDPTQRANTLVIFTSDNGGPERCNGEDYEGRFKDQKGPHSDNGPLRGFKSSVYDGGVLAPAFVSWPGTLAPRSETAVLSAMDWLPTIAALTGSPLPSATDGQDVWPILCDAKAGADRELYWRTTKDFAIRLGDWKLIMAKGKAGQLYNLKDDPFENTDVAAKNGALVESLQRKLKQWTDGLPQIRK
jgi:arylsulfatase A-like enzyme